MSDRPLTIDRGAPLDAWLPAPARAKYRRLVEQQQETAAVLRELSERRTEAINRRMAADDHLRRVNEQTPPRQPPVSVSLPSGTKLGVGGQHYMPPAFSREQAIENAQAAVGEAREAVARLDERIAAAQARSIAPVLGRIDAWLRDLPAGTSLEMHRGSVQPPKGDPKAAVEKLRSELAQARNALERVRAAPLPAAAVKGRIAGEIAALAEAGRPQVSFAPGARARVTFPTVTRLSTSSGALPLDKGRIGEVSTLGSLALPDTLATLAWLAGDALKSALHAEVDRLADDRNALDEPTRTKRLAELTAQLLELERTEEAAIEAGEDAGITIRRRDDASIESILNLAAIRHPAAAAA